MLRMFLAMKLSALKILWIAMAVTLPAELAGQRVPVLCLERE